MEQPEKRPSKRAWLKKELEALIAKGQAGDRLPTYVQMIRQYDVGQATVDYVIQELSIEGKIVRKRSNGIFISDTAKRRSVGLLCGWDSAHDGAAVFARQLADLCRQRIQEYGQDYAFYLQLPAFRGEFPPDPAGLVPDLKAGRLEGILSIGVEGTRIDALLEEAGIPRVLYSSASDRVDRVGVDAASLVEQGVSALAYSGSRRLGLLSGGLGRDDLAAFRAALARHGLECVAGAALARPAGGAPENAEQVGCALARELFGGAVPNRHALDGLIVTDDSLAAGALVALDRLGLRVPRDVRVAASLGGEASPLRCQADRLILLEIDPRQVMTALFAVLEKWMFQGIQPQQPHLVPVTLRLPVGSAGA